jgi:hypothetical protein
VAQADVRLARVASDLVVTDSATAESITVRFEFPDVAVGNGIERIAFDDGTAWNRAAINANAVIYGTGGNDNLYGSADGEIFDSLAGDDTVYGGGGGDMFIDRAQSGNDTIYEDGFAGDTNTLRLVGVSEANVRLDRSGNDLVVERLDSGKNITVTYQFAASQPNFGVEQIAFDDGTVWSKSTIKANAEIYGTPGGDMLQGTGDDEIFDGLGGSDTYTDRSGASDTFVYASSYGNDTIDYQVYDSAHTGTLRLTDINPSGITLTQSGSDLYITVTATGNAIRDVAHFSASTRGIDRIAFADGTVWNRSTIDANAQPPLTGGAGDYLLTRGSGHVTVFASTITGTVRVPAGVAAGDIILQGDNSGNLPIGVRGSGDSVTLTGDLGSNWWGISSKVANITFADGSTMATTTVLTGSNYGSNVFDLAPGGDTITGGNASLGASGANTLVFDKGDGHAQVNLNGGSGTLQMAADIAASDVILQADNIGNLTVKLVDTGDSITIAGDLVYNWWGISSHLQQITYADGTSVNVAQPGYGQGTPPVFTWIGTATTTVLTGSNYGTNVFDLGPGGDTVIGGNTSLGVSGANTLLFDKGDGQVQVNLNGGTGTIKMAADIAASDVILQADSIGDLIVKLRDAADSITVAHDLVSQWWGVSTQVSQIGFADGSSLSIGQPGYNQGPAPTFTWLGTASNDSLTGSAFGNNVFEGGAGNDTLNGGGGYDTYKLASGFGQSLIHNLASDGYSPKGEIDLGAGVTHDQLWLARSGNDLQIDLLGTSQDVTISGWYAGNARAQVQSVDTGDGLKLDSQLQQLVGAMATYATNHAGFDPTQSLQMPADQTLQTAIAAAWH